MASFSSGGGGLSASAPAFVPGGVAPAVALTSKEKEKKDKESRKRFQLLSILIVDKVCSLLRDEWKLLYKDNLTNLRIVYITFRGQE